MKYLLVLVGMLLWADGIRGQVTTVTLSGIVKDRKNRSVVAYATVVLRHMDSTRLAGTITNEEGRFVLPGVASGDYLLEVSYTGYRRRVQPVRAGRLSAYLDLGTVELEAEEGTLDEVRVTGTSEGIGQRMDKKSYSLSRNISQGGGSVLQALRNLPGITVNEEGRVQLRGSDQVTILVDGRQTALTGFGNQAGLDNIPASAIERIEIINNPSARYDANGHAGIINIIYKSGRQEGWNGKIGLVAGLGALWEKRENLPGIRPQYRATPKLNPSLSLNYRKKKVNAFVQGDYLYNRTLNKNDFSERYYANGDTVLNQVKRNRITTVGTVKTGFDWQPSARQVVTVSGLYSSEYVRDHGDLPYYAGKRTDYFRLWQFYEDEVNTAATATVQFLHRFRQPGHQLSVGYNYTFHREDEKYFLTDNRSTYTGRDTFMLLADEHVSD
ncbi:MAG TPA: TonB-dependent receptor, partial [Chitinophagaceae bacterium]|nr:TonB-dependent receptor [Chitinophagaceae bacterium]